MKLNERKLTKAEVSKREDIIMDMKKNKRELTKRYGKDAEKVMYGRATNLAKKQLENMDPKSKLREMIKTALSSTNEEFTKKYDDDDALKGGQKDLPDGLQKAIINKSKVKEELEDNPNYVPSRKAGDSIMNRHYDKVDWPGAIRHNDKVYHWFKQKDGITTYFDAQNPKDKLIFSSKEEMIDLIKEEKTPTPQKGWYSPISLVSKRRAQADIKQFIKGKRADGMGDYDAIILGVEKDGNQTQLKTLDDFNSKYVEYYLADYNYKTNSYKIPKYQNVKEDFRVEYKTQDGENAKSRIYKTKEEAEKKEAELVDKSRIKQAKIVSVDSGLKEDLDLGHQDDEPHMLKSNLYRIGKYAMELYQMMDKFEGQGEVDLPHWWQSKIIKSESMITSAKHYLDFELKEPEIDAMVDVASEEGAISEEKSQIPSQEEVDRFFEETQNEMHYLASKPVMGQEKTFNNVEVEAWDEYDLSNWNALVRKKKEGRSPFGESKYSQLAEKIVKNLKKKALNEDVEEWPKEHPSRYNEYRFELEKVSPTYKGKPGRALYKLIDIESGELKATPAFGKVEQLMAYADDLIKPQGGTQSSQFEESLNEDKDFKKGDKLKVKLKNGKEFNLTFDSYMKQKGMAFGKFKNKYGEFDTKPFPLDTIINESLKK